MQISWESKGTNPPNATYPKKEGLINGWFWDHGGSWAVNKVLFPRWEWPCEEPDGKKHLKVVGQVTGNSRKVTKFQTFEGCDWLQLAQTNFSLYSLAKTSSTKKIIYESI